MPTVRISLLTFLFAITCLTIQAQSPYTELKTNEIIFVKWFLSNYERLNDLETLQKEAISLSSIFDKTNIDRIGIMSNDSAYFLSVISRKSEFSFPADWCKEFNTLSRNKIERLDRKKRRKSLTSAFEFFALSRPIFLENLNEYWIYLQWNGLGDDGGSEVRRYKQIDNDFVQTDRQILQIR